jgi:hypothetical protein
VPAKLYTLLPQKKIVIALIALIITETVTWIKHDRRCKYHVTLRSVRATIVAVEQQ